MKMNTSTEQSQNKIKYIDILDAKKIYTAGENVTEFLRRQINCQDNSPEIIELAYDLQAGSYIKHVEENRLQISRYSDEIASILGLYLSEKDTLLDIGTGELTTLSLVIQRLINKPEKIFAFDISWSRVYKGLSFACEYMGASYQRLVPLVADIEEIPLPDKSINITTSSHALEPNGKKLKALMQELFRVTADKLILFEPCYEMNSDEGKKRMDKLGYVKNIDLVIEKLGGKLIEKIIIKNISNPLNPTVCWIISPPESNMQVTEKFSLFSVPGASYPLHQMDNFYFSNATGLCYPILKSIPILKSNAAILASALSTG